MKIPMWQPNDRVKLTQWSDEVGTVVRVDGDSVVVAWPDRGGVTTHDAKDLISAREVQP